MNMICMFVVDESLQTKKALYWFVRCQFVYITLVHRRDLLIIQKCYFLWLANKGINGILKGFISLRLAMHQNKRVKCVNFVVNDGSIFIMRKVFIGLLKGENTS